MEMEICERETGGTEGLGAAQFQSFIGDQPQGNGLEMFLREPRNKFLTNYPTCEILETQSEFLTFN